MKLPNQPDASGDKGNPGPSTAMETIPENEGSQYKKYIESSSFSTDSAWTSLTKCIEYSRNEEPDVQSFWHDFGLILKA